MNSRAAFVAIGLAVNLLILARGVALMLALGYADLGFVALVQAGITFVGMMHFGLLNGGYRLLCHAGPRTRQRIVDLAYTGFAAITLTLVVIALIAVALTGNTTLWQVAGLAIIGGVATLMRSWMMNEMVAGQRLRAANAINAASALVSLAALAPVWAPQPFAAPAVIAAGAIALQPVVFAGLALLSGAVMRPRALRASPLIAKPVLRAGFALFIAGLALQLIPLMERAYLTHYLGLEALGRLYLAILFVTLFQMAPNLIQQVFLPPVVELWRKRDGAAIQRELRALLGVMMAYCAAAALGVWLVAEPLLAAVLPAYVADLRWVYILTPGLIVFALSTPFCLSFNVLIDYRWYLIAYIAGAVVSALVLASATLGSAPLGLDQITFLRSAVFALMGAVAVFGSWRITARTPQLRVFGANRDAAPAAASAPARAVV